MKSYWRIFFICSAWFLLLPVFASAQVVISEIMYDLGGDFGDSDTDREWIEVYNECANDVDLTGWKFYENETNHGLTPSGSSILSGGEYAVIVDDETEFRNDWPNYTGILFDSSFSLNNTGEALEIRDSDLNTIDQTSYDSETEPGASAKQTGNSLQKTDSGWIADYPTPGSGSLSPDTGCGDGGDDGGGGSNGGSGGSSDSGSSSSQSEQQYEEGQTTAEIITPSTATVGVPTQFSARVIDEDGNEVSRGKFTWNLGDLTTREDSRVEGFKHTYKYSGDYVVVLEYYKSSYSRDPEATDRAVIKVVPATVEISNVGEGQDVFVELKNTGKYEMDLSNWSLRSKGKSFSIPKNTIILAGRTIILPSELIGFEESDRENLSLYFPGGDLAHAYSLPSVIVESSEDIIEEMEGQEGSSAETETEAGIEELSYAPELSPKLAQEEQSSVEADSTESERIVAVLSPEGTADSSFLQEESESALAKALSVQAGAAAAALAASPNLGGPAREGKNSSGRRGFGLLLAAVVIVSAAAALYIRKTAPKDGAEVKNFLHQPANKTQKSFADDFEFIE